MKSVFRRGGRKRRRVAVLDIPLLFETGGDRRCDACRGLGAARCPAGARIRAARYDRREVRRDPCQRAARCRETRARRFPGGYARVSAQHAHKYVIFLRVLLQCRNGAGDSVTAETDNARKSSLDVETTGLDPTGPQDRRSRLCRAAESELRRGDFHVYLTPDRDMPAEAFASPRTFNGVSEKSQALWRRYVDEFLAFIGDAPLVIHNAGFDHTFSVCRAQTSRSFVDCTRTAGR